MLFIYPPSFFSACIVPTDHLIIASVSNWGGYALCAAAAVLFVTGRQHTTTIADVMVKDGEGDLIWLCVG
jgi:hypothetical protein